MKKRILEKLKKNEGYISGEKLSEEFGVSRTAVWKNINSLKEEGYKIVSAPRRGYKLVSNPDILSKEEILPELDTEFIGQNYIYIKEVDSTNEEIKRRSGELEDGSAVVSEHQTAGKGRLGRKWYSPEKEGIYFSLILRPEIPPFEAPKITQIGAAALVKTLSELGIEAKVKWPNDIVAGGKKIAGILTEMSGELMAIDYIVLGIGINTSIDYGRDIEGEFGESLKEKAGSLSDISENFDRKSLLIKLFENFEELYKDFLNRKTAEKSIEICREYSAVLGKKVRIIRKNEETVRKAVEIDENGALVLEDENGNRETVISGEVSVRGESSYI